jgi:hypothetical protein
MSEELKRCPFCGSEVTIKDVVIYPNGERSPARIKCCKCNYFITNFENDNLLKIWNTRPIEDELKKVICGMFPLWITAMSYCEHGRKEDLMRMRNYYNGRDNPMTSKDIKLMFSLIPEKGGEE